MLGRDAWLRVRNWFEKRGLKPAVALAYLGLAVLFLVAVAQFYSPGRGFSYLISFGDEKTIPVRLSKINRMDFHFEQGSAGYDAQYYVQIAMDPSLQNQGLRRAVDSLSYRARRILFPALAYALGFGQPPVILEVFALENVAAWLLLGALLLHWFPPRRWENFFRWAGVLLSFGVCVSVRNALTDGPSLLLVSFGLYLAEKGRPGWATAVLGVAGLGKETNLLGGAALLPPLHGGGRAWALAIGRGLLVALPLALWLAYIAVQVGPAMDAGQRNFSLPFVAYGHKWMDVLRDLPNVAWHDLGALCSCFMMVSLTVQLLFLVLRPRWSQAWWRVGMSFGLLMIVLGDAVWEGYPGAASRVLLPMQVAFNVLVPFGRGWRLVLLAGNLTLLAGPTVLQPPVIEGYVLTGDSAVITNPAGQALTMQFSRDGWYASEGNRSFYWSWAKGRASHEIRNPQDFPLNVRLRFGMFCVGHRLIRLKLNGEEVWSTRLQERQTITARLSGLRLLPGKNLLEWETDVPAVKPTGDPRDLAFVVQNLRLEVQGKAPDETAK